MALVTDTKKNKSAPSSSPEPSVGPVGRDDRPVPEPQSGASLRSILARTTSRFRSGADVPDEVSSAEAGRKPVSEGLRRLRRRGLFSALTGRIIFVNLFGLILLVGGVLFLNQFRAGLIDARLHSLMTEGSITAGALALSAIYENEQPSDEMQFNLDEARPIIRRAAKASGTRIRLYDHNGDLVLDSRDFVSAAQVQTYSLPPPGVLGEWPFIASAFDWFASWIPATRYPAYTESGHETGWIFEEVAFALVGERRHALRVNDKKELIVSVGVPVQRLKVVQGALFLSTARGDIDDIVRAERVAIFQIFLVALLVSLCGSLYFSRTIGKPVRQLAEAAERIRHLGAGWREMPNLESRRDELGDLSSALREMTHALSDRIRATERFAADVAHEIKNPLTSMRSAVETFSIAKDDEKKARLLGVIAEDVGRIDRLITDISDASRLDGELTREHMAPVNVGALLKTLVRVYEDTLTDDAPIISLQIDTGALGEDVLTIPGVEHRLGQVFRNILDNAISFSEPGDRISIRLRIAERGILVSIDDQGPGIPEENLAQIFDRFYTQRPNADDFGKNSGLGLSISKQIVEAHKGKIWAENRREPDGHCSGARFLVSLPNGR